MLQPERNICSFIDIALRFCVYLTSRNDRLWLVCIHCWVGAGGLHNFFCVKIFNGVNFCNHD